MMRESLKVTLDNLLTRVGALSSLTSGITNTSIINAINSIYALDASISTKGFVTTGSQAIAGDKTLTGALILNGNQLSFASTIASNYVVLRAGASASSFYLTLPTALPVSTSFLVSSNTGALSFTTSVVTSVATGAGLSGGPITSTGTITLAASGVSTGTYGSSSFIPQLVIDTYGRITGAVNITVPTASGSVIGYLSNTDWTTFNSKFNTPSLTTNSIPYWNGAVFAEDSNLSYTPLVGGDPALKVPSIINIGVEVNSNIRTVTVTGNIEKDDTTLIITPATSATVVLTLPDTSLIDVGHIFYFKVTTTDATSIKLATIGGDTINGGAEQALSLTKGYAAVQCIANQTFETLYLK